MASPCIKSKNDLNNVFSWDIDIHNKAGHLRSVDWIDFITFILPSTVIEALQLQKREVLEKEANSRAASKMTTEQLVSFKTAVDASCEGLIFFSKACRISQKFSLSDSDIRELERYITAKRVYSR